MVKFNFEIDFKKGKYGKKNYYISSIKGTPFIAQGKTKDECTIATFEMITGFFEAFPKDYKKHLRKYGILK